MPLTYILCYDDFVKMYVKSRTKVHFSAAVINVSMNSCIVQGVFRNNVDFFNNFISMCATFIYFTQSSIFRPKAFLKKKHVLYHITFSLSTIFLLVYQSDITSSWTSRHDVATCFPPLCHYKAVHHHPYMICA